MKMPKKITAENAKELRGAMKDKNNSRFFCEAAIGRSAWRR